jgi:RNA polymerase sigma-70 factor (ECF subfamily)
MSDPAGTRPSLLIRIRDPRDDAAWSQFAGIYTPLVYGFARKQGWQDADAADLTQDVLRSVAAAISHVDYDPRRGSFRGWLFTVVRNKLRDFAAAQGRVVHGTGDTAAHQVLAEQPDRATDELAEWETDYERQLFAWAAERVRGEVQESTWQAFWQTAVEGRSGQDVAAGLNISVAAVYLAKSRVMARLKLWIAEARRNDSP